MQQNSGTFLASEEADERRRMDGENPSGDVNGEEN